MQRQRQVIWAASSSLMRAYAATRGTAFSYNAALPTRGSTNRLSFMHDRVLPPQNQLWSLVVYECDVWFLASYSRDAAQQND